MTQAKHWSGQTVELASASEAAAVLASLCWHDSILYRVALDRELSSDTVTLDLRLLSGSDEWASIPVRLSFLRCMSVRCEMNWGVDCMSDGEMIYGAEAGHDGPAIARVRSQWAKLMSFTSGELGSFHLELASTGSILELVFRGFRIEPTGPAAKHPAPPPRPMDQWPADFGQA